MSKLELSGCCITSGALNGNAHTSRVTPGKTYGHVVSITEYWQLVARNIEKWGIYLTQVTPRCCIAVDGGLSAGSDRVRGPFR